MVTIFINRTHNNLYSYVIFPWACGVLNVAINYGAVWLKKNHSGGQNLMLYAKWTDGVTTSATNPTGYIDTTGGSALYIGPSTFKIQNITNPTNNQDVATKSYTDTQVSSVVKKCHSGYVPSLNKMQVRRVLPLVLVQHILLVMIHGWYLVT